MDSNLKNQVKGIFNAWLTTEDRVERNKLSAEISKFLIGDICIKHDDIDDMADIIVELNKLIIHCRPIYQRVIPLLGIEDNDFKEKSLKIIRGEEDV